jgi:hypothetical protein
MGKKNTGADHAEKCRKGLNHRNCPLTSWINETAWRAEQSKGIAEPQSLRMATDDFRQQ